MIYSQRGIYDTLRGNPLGIDVCIGDLEDMNGKDYIFLDYENEDLIPSDDHGVYRTSIQVTVASRNFDRLKITTNYLKSIYNFSVDYEKSSDFEYYLARCTTTILIKEQTDGNI